MFKHSMSRLFQVRLLLHYLFKNSSTYCKKISLEDPSEFPSNKMLRSSVTQDSTWAGRNKLCFISGISSKILKMCPWASKLPYGKGPFFLASSKAFCGTNELFATRTRADGAS